MPPPLAASALGRADRPGHGARDGQRLRVVRAAVQPRERLDGVHLVGETAQLPLRNKTAHGARDEGGDLVGDGQGADAAVFGGDPLFQQEVAGLNEGFTPPNGESPEWAAACLARDEAKRQAAEWA